MGIEFDMMTKETVNLSELSLSEKILLAEDLWDEIAVTATDSFPLTEKQKAELERRWAAFEKNPTEVHSLKDIKKELLGL